jgi:hypothetical protein
MVSPEPSLDTADPETRWTLRHPKDLAWTLSHRTRGAAPRTLTVESFATEKTFQ